MNPVWQQFLDNRAIEHGQVAANTENFISPLHADGLILARGEEAENFLQNQLGNDLRLVDDGHSQLSCYSNPKGRLLAILRMLHCEDGYLIRLPASILEETLKRLRMFVMRAKLELLDASATTACFGASGPLAEAQLRSQLGALPESADDALRSEDLCVVRVAGDGPRYELYGTPETLQSLWTQLASAGCNERPASAWRLEDIRAGLPNIYPETRETFVAQMTNLQLVNGLSFKKGCYPGQEIVARMQYLGQLKRRMYRFDIDSDDAPLPGTELFNAEGKSAGVLVDVAPSPAGHAALAVLRIEHAEKVLHWGSADGPAATPAPLPYALEG